MMKKYIVGGAVRDSLLGKNPKDVDYLVVGSSEEEFVKAHPDFTKVGSDFPVFLDHDGNEWALARRERKVGHGYTGFVSEVEGVTLEEDLMRRDFTIGSMAIDLDGFELVDPFGGQIDLKNKVLRHTSAAFVEDPVRVLRLARFMSRFGPDWKVADETKALCFKMAKDGVLSELQPDRVWKEFVRAMDEDYPWLFFETLRDVNALNKVFPNIWRLQGALENLQWHPEGNAFEHTMLVMKATKRLGGKAIDMYAALMHDIGKTLTPLTEMPKHYGHDVKGVALVSEMNKYMSVPSDYTKVAEFVCRYHMYGHDLKGKNPKTIAKMFDHMNASHDHSQWILNTLLTIFCADHRGRLGSEDETIDHIIDTFEKYRVAYRSVKFEDVFKDGKKETIKDQMFKARVSAVKGSK